MSVDSSLTTEELLARLARSYSALPRPLLLLVDLVEGTSDPAFARGAATFVRALASSVCRIAIFGQESALREFSPLEREQLGVNRVDVRGFRFEEFVKLVGFSHPNPDRGVLWDIYERITAGREAGLFAGLARALAAAKSLQEMSAMAARPAQDVLPFAEQRRFAQVSGGARTGAEKLVCFALPFRQKDAEQIFSGDNIGAAIRELLRLGLLRSLDDDLFEMHEAVRAGLEGTIARNVRVAAHEALAAWYGRQGNITAEILHLEKAGRQTEARARARDAFMRGKSWRSLTAYVTENRLVSAEEVISVVADVPEVEDKYIFPSILRQLGRPVDANGLFQVIRRHPERITADYQGALAIFEAMLEFNPALLDDLIRFVLETVGETHRKESALGSLMLAARRSHAFIGPATIELFKSAPAETKRWLLPFMLAARRRDALRPALQFIATEPQDLDPQRGALRSLGLALQIDQKEDAIEFLASIPDVRPVEMLTARSALLGPLDGLIWPRRKELELYCAQILKDATESEKIVESAIRVLVFLGYPAICALCEPLLPRTDSISRLAALVPVLVPDFCDRGRYEAKVLDPTLRTSQQVIRTLEFHVANVFRFEINLGAPKFIFPEFY